MRLRIVSTTDGYLYIFIGCIFNYRQFWTWIWYTQTVRTREQTHLCTKVWRNVWEYKTSIDIITALESLDGDNCLLRSHTKYFILIDFDTFSQLWSYEWHYCLDIYLLSRFSKYCRGQECRHNTCWKLCLLIIYSIFAQ